MTMRYPFLLVLLLVWMPTDLLAEDKVEERGSLHLHVVPPNRPLSTVEGERKTLLICLEMRKRDSEGNFVVDDTSPLVVEVGSTTELSLLAGVWRLAIMPGDWWSEPAEIEVESGIEKRLDLSLHSTGTVRGAMVTAPGVKLPGELSVDFKASPGYLPSTTELEGTISCTPEKEAFSCELPIGTLDLRFQAPGTVPEHRWGVRIEESESQHLEPLHLRHGTAVLGWIITEDGAEPAAGAGVHLWPKALGRLRNRSRRHRTELAQRKTVANSRGFFRFDGLPPGDYLLEANNPSYTSTRATVRVIADKVTEIDNPPLILRKPLLLNLYLNPPVTPAGETWLIDLKRLDRSQSTLETIVEGGEVGSEGSWQRHGLSPGAYRLTIGDRNQRRYWREELVFESGETTHFVDLPVIEMRGTILWGSEPLAAGLYFGGPHGAVSIEFTSRENGEFMGHLPRDGLWTVLVEAEEPRLRRSLQIDVQRRPGRSYATVELDLPATRLLSPLGQCCCSGLQFPNVSEVR